MEEGMIDPVLKNLKVLIVEDQTEVRMQLKDQLTELGITQVFEAPDARAAMQLLDGAFVDFVNLILCDWNMPSMSGIEFLRQIRGAGIQTPFMMITGRGDQKSVIEARNYGVDGYIRKPFTPLQIEAKLRSVAHKALAA